MESGANNDLAWTAADWVARRNSGLDSRQRRELLDWLAADERHARAFAQADKGGTEFDWPLHTGMLRRVEDGLERKRRRRAVARRVTMGAFALVAVVLVIGVFLRPPWGSMVVRAQTSGLVVKAPQRLLLPDGSVIEMKDDADVITKYSEELRLVILTRGTAHFQVAKETRPFVVRAGGVLSKALGTRFSVELQDENVFVLVTEGRVAVNKASDLTAFANAASSLGAAAETAILDAGKAVNVSQRTLSDSLASSVTQVPAGEIDERLSWRVPLLEFTGTPLLDVVNMINSHNRLRFVISDPALEQITLSGVLRADNVDGLLTMIKSDFNVKADWRGDQIFLREGK